MSPEAVDYFAKAERTLDRARGIAKAGYYEEAARGAYTAALSAARGLIFDKTGKSVKTHSGARSQLFQLIDEGLQFDPKLAAFLNDGFEVKQAVDYETSQADVSRAKAESSSNVRPSSLRRPKPRSRKANGRNPQEIFAATASPI